MILLLTAAGLFTPKLLHSQAKYYITSSGNQPWNQPSTINCLNSSFGSNNWTQSTFQSVNVNAMCTGTTCFIYLEGGDTHANALNTFLTSNLLILQNWVFNGGRLLINAAPNVGGNINYGFGGVTLNYGGPCLSTPGYAAPGQSLHPIFTGSNQPCGTSFTGNWFSHGYMTGGSTTSLIQGTVTGLQGPVTTLCEMNYGAGLVIFGSMTFPNFHQPQPNGLNLLQNIFSYLYVCCPITASASPSSICAGSGSTLTAYGSSTYTWSPGSVASASVMVTPTANSVYTVIGTNSIGCQGATTVSVGVLPPCISVTSTSITCASLGSATVVSNGGIGPFSYTWIPTYQSGSVATGLSPGTYSIVVHDFGNNFTYTTTTVFTSLIPLTGNLVFSPSVACNGATTGSAAITNLAGGSGTQFYNWTNGVVNYTVPSPTNLSAGLWNLNVTDALTGCVINQPFIITQPFALSPVITASSPTVCAGGSISFTASNSGGSPGPGAGYTYTWTGGPQSTNYTVSQNMAGNYVYTVNSRDGNNCLSSQTIAVDFVPNPTLTVLNMSICPLETGTLLAGGAVSYTWMANSALTQIGNSFTQSPLVTTQYSVIGSALGCNSSASASIILKPLPNVLFQSNSPVCQGNALIFTASTGTAFVWSGVANYTSNAQSNLLSSSHPTQSGVYMVTVTAANSCTASTQGTITIHPTPTLSAYGSTLCITQAASLNANSFPGSNYVWTGPNNFVSLLQNPLITNPSVATSGNYTVKVTSLPGCTATAMANVTVTPLPVISFSTNSPQCFGKNLIFYNFNTTGALNYNWTGPNGFSSNIQNPILQNVTLLATGNYTLTVSTGPCVVSANQAATIHPLPTPLANNTSPACEGKNFQLSVNNSGISYSWTGPNGYNSNQQIPQFSNVLLSHAGTYTVLVTDANSCQNTAVTTATVLQNPVLSASGELVCYGEPAQLSVTGADTYTWTGPSAFLAYGSSPIVNPAINVQVWTYTATGTALNGCTAVATATIGTRVLPIASLTVTPRVCVKSTVFLNGEGGLNYHWTGPLNFVSELQNTQVTAFNTGAGGTYSLRVSDVYGCRGYTTAQVIVDPEPTGAIVGSKLFGCVPFCGTYSLQPIGTGTVSHSIWEINNQTFSSPSFSYCFLQAGNFEIRGSFENQMGCKGNMSQLIEVYALPEAEFSYLPFKPVENQDVVIFTNASKGDEQTHWTWAFDDGKHQTRKGINSEYFFEDAGYYTVVLLVENKWGCADTIIKSIEVVPDFNVYIPNAFTPNDDGLNDTFYPVLRGVKQFDLKIFDRWGALVFASNTAEHMWNGTFKGENCPQGIYSYKLVLLNNKGEEKEYTGGLSLFR